MINENTINKILLIFHYERIHNIQFRQIYPITDWRGFFFM